jgi:hypothetical protein
MMKRPKSGDSRLAAKKMMGSSKSREIQGKPAEKLSVERNPVSIQSSSTNQMRNQLSALFSSTQTQMEQLKKKQEKEVRNQSGLGQNSRWVESGFLEQNRTKV